MSALTALGVGLHHLTIDLKRFYSSEQHELLQGLAQLHALTHLTLLNQDRDTRALLSYMPHMLTSLTCELDRVLPRADEQLSDAVMQRVYSTLSRLHHVIVWHAKPVSLPHMLASC